MNIKYLVELTAEERLQLEEMTSKGKHSARTIRRANILLMADSRRFSDDEIAQNLSVGTSTVYRIK